MGSHMPNEAEPSIEAQTLSEAESSVNGQQPNLKAEPSIEVADAVRSSLLLMGSRQIQAEPSIEAQLTLSEAESSVNGQPPNYRQSLPSRRRTLSEAEESSVNGQPSPN